MLFSGSPKDVLKKMSSNDQLCLNGVDNKCLIELCIFLRIPDAVWSLGFCSILLCLSCLSWIVSLATADAFDVDSDGLGTA